MTQMNLKADRVKAGRSSEGCRSSNKLIVVCGLSFAGKSTLADAICADFGYRQVDVDDTKLGLYGPGIDDQDLSPAEWTRIYRETDDRIVMHLRNGDSVVDASRNFRQRERNHARAIADRMGAEVLLVYVDTPEALVRQRWAENREKQTRRDVSEKGFEEITEAMEAPTVVEQALVFRHNEEIRSWLAEHAEHLEGKQHDPAERAPTR